MTGGEQEGLGLVEEETVVAGVVVGRRGRAEEEELAKQSCVVGGTGHRLCLVEEERRLRGWGVTGVIGGGVDAVEGVCEGDGGFEMDGDAVNDGGKGTGAQETQLGVVQHVGGGESASMGHECFGKQWGVCRC